MRWAPPVRAQFGERRRTLDAPRLPLWGIAHVRVPSVRSVSWVGSLEASVPEPDGREHLLVAVMQIYA